MTEKCPVCNRDRIDGRAMRMLRSTLRRMAVTSNYYNPGGAEFEFKVAPRLQIGAECDNCDNDKVHAHYQEHMKMSNATDVLIVSGDDAGEIVCMQLDDTKIILGAARYTPAPFLHTDGKEYWIAFPFSALAEPPSDEIVSAAIVEHNHKPAWDLNRA